MTARFVTISKFSEETGYTVGAVEQKIHRGIWLQNREFRRAPDNRILMDMEGFNKWVENQRAGACALETPA